MPREHEQRTHARGRAGGDTSTSPRAGLRPGMQVRGSDGALVGHIDEVREDDFLVEHTAAHGVYVPFSAVDSAEDNVVVLNVRSTHINDMGWRRTTLLGPEPEE